MNVLLSTTPASAPWEPTSLVTISNDQFIVHVENVNDLDVLQCAGRKVESFGPKSVSLVGDNWSQEAQWAFHCGFSTVDKQQSVVWATHLSEDEIAELNARAVSTNWTKQWMNACPAEVYPESLADAATQFLKDLAPNYVTATVTTGDELLANGWVGTHSVGRGSDKPPVMLELDFNPTGDDSAPISAVLVGKGITFDSGGYSIKTSQGMVAMKFDMGGAATVTGALALAIQRGLNKRVKLILCCAENLINGNAYKLGDILHYKNGVSVEIVNTDAEGRLVLADGLIRAGELGAPLVINAATLTGAAHVALGDHYNAIFALDSELQQKALHAAKEEQERHWPLPLEPFHQKQCPSAYAETANSRAVKGGGGGGASNAAGFLSRFVSNEGKGWLHFDLAAAYREGNGGDLAEGATAIGVRTIAKLIM